MKLKAFLAIVGIVAILFGIAFVVAPAQLLAQYGITADRYTIFMSRFFGAALINLGLLVWLARNVIDPLARQAIVLAGLVADVIGFIIALEGQMHGVVNALGWSTVVIYALFALGFAYFQFAPQRSTA
jgi:hypothetical protein